jgi:cbb3-type cytochrome oxidase subunit 3
VNHAILTIAFIIVSLSLIVYSYTQHKMSKLWLTCSSLSTAAGAAALLIASWPLLMTTLIFSLVANSMLQTTKRDRRK